MRTTKFTLVLGTNPGYGHQNKMDASCIGPMWQVVAKTLHAETGILVSGTLIAGKSIYPEDFGCPFGGEFVGMLVGVRNPKFAPDDEAWRNVVRTMARTLKNSLQQTTAYLDFTETEFEYLE